MNCPKKNSLKLTIMLCLALGAQLICFTSAGAGITQKELGSLISPADVTMKAMRPANQDKLTAFLQNTLDKLPQNLVQKLAGQFQISFTNFNSAELPTPLCQADRLSDLRDQFEVMPAPFIDAKRFLIPGAKNENPKYLIKLNSNFLRVILLGEEKSITYQCGHGNLYRYAEAVLVRELARLYDDLNIYLESNAKEHALLWQCAFVHGPIPTGQIDERCKEFSKWQHSISDRPYWIHLRHRQNNLNLQALSDDFSRHMEFFVLDPEFPCRRPAVNAFLNKYFAVNSTPQCELNTSIPINLASDFLTLDLKRLYQVHVLLADPGAKIESQWGHIMFRLVFCDSQRTTVGPECLKDINSHLVLGFQGAPRTLLASNWDGVRGKYPSVLSIQGFGTALNQYTVKQSRNMTSVPLNLSQEEKTLFIYRTLEDFWSYHGKYIFLTNNCATEALHFLQSIVQHRNDKLLRRESLIETPMNFYEFLIESNYAEGSVLKDDAQKDSYILSSPRQQWKKDAGQELIAKLETLNAKERREIYEKMKSAQPDRMRQMAILFYENELEVFNRLMTAKDQILQNFAMQDQKNLNGEYAPLVNQLQNYVTLLAPKNLATPGYGVPLISEFKSDKKIDFFHSEINTLKSKIEVLLRRDQPEIYAFMADSNNNMKYFYKDIKKANAANK